MIAKIGLRTFGGSLTGLGLVLMACSSGSMPVASKFVKTATVGASGGTLTVAATEDLAIAGTSITIPPNALAANVTISIGVSASAVARAGATSIGPMIDFEPSGTTFALPVTITVPATLPSGGSASSVFVEAVEADQSAHQITAQYAGGLASIQASDLAEFAAYYVTESAVSCSTDADCAPGGVCTAGTCTGTRVPPDGGGGEADSSTPGACSDDSDCLSGESCVDGLCSVVSTGADAGAGDASDASTNPSDDAAACSGTETNCGGVCVDINSDNANCGECGITCPSGSTCMTGRCF